MKSTELPPLDCINQEIRYLMRVTVVNVMFYDADIPTAASFHNPLYRPDTSHYCSVVTSGSWHHQQSQQQQQPSSGRFCRNAPSSMFCSPLSSSTTTLSASGPNDDESFLLRRHLQLELRPAAAGQSASAQTHQLDRSSSKDTSSAAASLPDSDDETGDQLTTSGLHRDTDDMADRDAMPSGASMSAEAEVENKTMKEVATRIKTATRYQLKVDCNSNNRFTSLFINTNYFAV